MAPIGKQMSDLWENADGARERPVSSWWKNGEVLLLLLEAGGCSPPGPDSEPPDHVIALAELSNRSRHLPPATNARIEADSSRSKKLSRVEWLKEMRVEQVRRDSLRPAWAEFYQREGMPEHAAKLQGHAGVAR